MVVDHMSIVTSIVLEECRNPKKTSLNKESNHTHLGQNDTDMVVYNILSTRRECIMTLLHIKLE